MARNRHEQIYDMVADPDNWRGRAFDAMQDAARELRAGNFYSAVRFYVAAASLYNACKRYGTPSNYREDKMRESLARNCAIGVARANGEDW